jgi:hypothetical protein
MGGTVTRSDRHAPYVSRGRGCDEALSSTGRGGAVPADPDRRTRVVNVIFTAVYVTAALLILAWLCNRKSN